MTKLIDHVRTALLQDSWDHLSIIQSALIRSRIDVVAYLSHRTSDMQVRKNLLGPSELMRRHVSFERTQRKEDTHQCIELIGALEGLHCAQHAGLGDTTTTSDLYLDKL